MILLILSTLLNSALIAQIIHPHKINEDNGEMYFEVPTKRLTLYCEKSPNTSNWFGGLETEKEQQSWFIRRPIDKEACTEFKTSINKILKSSQTVKILGNAPRQKDGSLSKDIYLDALKGKKDCWEWFKGECKKF